MNRLLFLLSIPLLATAQTLAVPCTAPLVPPADGGALIVIITAANPSGLCYSYPGSLYAGTLAIAGSRVQNLSPVDATGRVAPTPGAAPPMATLSPEDTLVNRAIAHRKEDANAATQQAVAQAVNASPIAKAAAQAATAAVDLITAQTQAAAANQANAKAQAAEKK